MIIHFSLHFCPHTLTHTLLTQSQLEFIESFGTSVYGGTVILAMEWVHTDYRVLGSMILALTFPAGEILLGIFAMFFHNFRYLFRILYGPGILSIIYLYLVPESVQWLLVSGRVERAIKILQKTARTNGKVLSQKSIEMIKLKYSRDAPQHQHSATVNTITDSGTDTDINKKTNMHLSIIQSLSAVIKSKTLCLRMLNCCYQFVAASFCYHGFNFSSLKIPGVNHYIGYILVSAFEIPAILIAIPLLKYTKRRKVLFISLILTSLLTIIPPLIVESTSIVVLISFMLAKTCISFTYNVVCVFTAEQWPTSCRSTIYAVCGMVGRIGSMAAPMTIILVNIILIMAQNFLRRIIEISPLFFVNNNLPCIISLHKPFRQHTTIHYQPCCSVDFQLFQRFQFSSVPKHMRKNYPILWMKRNICDLFVHVA